ncbi:magnesium chelatase subunit D [Nakamurella sp. UYEF19]
MNPEEGELRPQLLDRFGLTVEITAPRDPALRAEVIRRRLAFDADPDGFARRYEALETAIASRILQARRVLASVALSDAAMVKIAEVCAAFEVDGMRADIVTARAAVAHAAWHERTTVTRADIRAAARLALPHRRRRNPFDAPGLDEELLDAILGDHEPGPDEHSGPPEEQSESGADPSGGTPETTPEADPATDESARDGSGNADATPASQCEQSEQAERPQTAQTPGRPATPESPVGTTTPTTAAAGAAYRTKLFTVTGSGEGEAGKRSRAITSLGRTVGASTPVGRASGAVHLTATMRAAAPHQLSRGRGERSDGECVRSGGRLVLRNEDVRMAIKEGRESNLVLFCVDASGSMAARKRMEQVKAAVLSLLMDAYQRRDKVGLVTFRGAAAVLALPPTSSIEIAARRLEDLPAGGRTPLAEGLLTARETLRLERIRDPRRRPLLVVVTDGRATAGPDALARSRQVAALLAAEQVSSLVIDCETGRFRMGLAGVLAQTLAAQYVPLGEVGAQALAGVVRDARSQNGRNQNGRNQNGRAA